MLKPMFCEDFPDPSIMYCEEDGFYYMYASRAWDQKGKNIQVRRAREILGPWEDLGCALRERPSWGMGSTEFWCPDVPIKVGGKWRLYYATNPDKGKGMAIAMAESSVPHDFVPAPEFLVDEAGYAAVDPFVLRYQGSEWLFWGSHHQPVKYQKLDPCGYRFAAGSQPRAILFPSHAHRYEKLIEGFFLVQHKERGVWYAFVSGSDTWDPMRYAVTIFSATSPFGPYRRVKVLIKPNKDWWAPGQNSVLSRDGEHYFVCHAAAASDPYFKGTNDRLKRIPCVARLCFDGGKHPTLRSL